MFNGHSGRLAELEAALNKDNSIKYVQRIDDVLFCHGGVTKYFVERYVPASKYSDISYVTEQINSLGHYEIWIY